jgi:DNA (cytosine-5)-methyltransferase 1
MKFLDLFSGIGGFRLGLEMAGHECIGHVEWDKYANASYQAMHQPKEEEFYGKDIREVRATELPRADIWCFGFPCQDISIAGKQTGFRGHRSSLFFTVTGLIRNIEEENKPSILFIENVKNLLSINGGWDFARLLIELDEIGYNATWKVLNSKDYGVAQNRERVFIIATLKGHSIYDFGEHEPIHTKLLDFLEDEVDEKYYIDNEKANKLIKQLSDKINTDRVAVDGTINDPKIKDTANYIKARYDADISNLKSDGTMVIESPIWGGMQEHQSIKTDGIVPCLTSSMGTGGGYVPMFAETAIPVLTPDKLEKRQNGRRFKEDGEPMFTLTAQDRHGVMVWDDMNGCIKKDQSTINTLTTKHCPHYNSRIIVKEATKQGYAIATEGDSINLEHPNSKTRRGRVGKGVAQTLTTSCNQATLDGYRIRKLTPKECFRLQGFSDEYFERARAVNSDSQLYKQAGNSVTVNVIYEIAKRLGDD